MFENHSEIARSLSGRRIDWTAFASKMSELGLKDRNGQAAKPHTVRITWLRVRKAVEKAAPNQPAMVQHETWRPAIPASSDIRPTPAVVVGQSGQTSIPAVSAALSATAATTVPDRTAYAPVTTSASNSTAMSVASLAPGPVCGAVRDLTAFTAVPAVDVPAESPLLKPKWTPEQQARIDASRARTMADLEHSDRFIKLKE